MTFFLYKHCVLQTLFKISQIIFFLVLKPKSNQFLSHLLAKKFLFILWASNCKAILDRTVLQEIILQKIVLYTLVCARI